MSDKLQTLKELLAEANNLDRAIRLVSWDQHTQMPRGGSEGRANVLAALPKLQHAHFTSDEMGRLLEDLSSQAADLDPESDDARLVSVTKRDYDIERKQPEKLVEAMSRASSAGFDAWMK